MIYFYLGENSFEIERELKKLVGSFDGEVQHIDAEKLSIGDLPDLLQGQTLFSDKRLVIIKQLSDNKPVWEAFSQRLEDLSSDVTILLIESQPDKRTKTFKDLKKRVEVKEFPVWTIRDHTAAINWLHDEAAQKGIQLTDAHARHIVQRIGYDQWRLFHALEKVALLDSITNDRIDDIIDVHPDENVFELLATALRGDVHGVQASIQQLRRMTDPYQTFGLLSSQLIQLTALALTDKSSQEVAKDIGAHPFVLSKLSSHATRLGVTDVRMLLAAAADTDMQMKSTGVEPWLLVEHLLIKIARR